MTTRPSKHGIAISSPDAPEEGSDAGSSKDLQRSYRASRIRSYRTSAKRSFDEAKRAFPRNSARAEEAIDAAIDAAAKGFWWAEDSSDEGTTHELLHKIGRWRRRNIGCYLQYDGTQYHRQCLVDLAHLRMGMSIGFIANRMCSICDADLSECPHLRGRSYWVRGGSGGSRGKCRVCQQKSCNHRSDRLYRASVIAIVSEGKIREVSIVKKPANPEARLTDVPVSLAELVGNLGPHFIPGVAVSCDKCLGDCPGFIELEDDHPNELSPDGAI